MESIYLDEAATTKPKEEVIQAMLPYLYEKWYNPSSLYNPSRGIKKDIEDVRKNVAETINANDSEIYFTSGGSESNNWAIQGFHNMYSESSIITTTIEHKSILECVNDMPDVHFIGVNADGTIKLEQLEKMLQYIKSRPILVSIQYANNEIGTIQNIKSVTELVHKYAGILHTDAVQAYGHIPIDVSQGIDLLSASGHKIGCPKGIGFLYKRNGILIKPLIYGSQEQGMRGGTENVPYIIGLGKAVELIKKNDTVFKQYSLMTCKRNYFMNQLKKKLGCKINGSVMNRLPNNINVTFPQAITGEALIYMLDTFGIYISSGSACNSHSMQPSYVLQAIGLSDDEIYKTIRITLPDDIDEDKTNKAISEISRQIKVMKSIMK